MKKAGFFLLCSVLILAGCDGVYDSSVQGVVLDWDDYNDSSVTDAGINDVDVYLYLDEKILDEDLNNWNTNGAWPENRVDKKGNQKAGYYAKTTTATSGSKNGVFGFNGVMWHNLFPEFGKPGDRVTLYFLFYHKDYGMVKADNPVTVTSGVTNNLPQFRIKKALCEVILSGYVVDMNKKQKGSANNLPLSNVTVNIYMPTTFDAAKGTAETWERTPKYTVMTDSEGRFEQKINFTKRSTPEVQKCPVKLTFEKADYAAYTLTSKAADIFSGLGSGGTNPGNVERDENNWVLLNGKEKVSLMYKGYNAGSTTAADLTEEIGGVGVEFTEKYDIDRDGEEEVCLPVVLECNTKNEVSSYKLGQNIFLRQYRFTTTVGGKIMDSNGATFSGSVMLADNSSYDNATTAWTVPTGTGDTNVHQYSMNYSWSVYNYTSEYSYQLVYMKAKVGGPEIPYGTDGKVLLTGASENAVDFVKP